MLVAQGQPEAPSSSSIGFDQASSAASGGYTRFKALALGCGSVPVLAEHEAHDAFYGRFLQPDRL